MFPTATMRAAMSMMVMMLTASEKVSAMAITSMSYVMKNLLSGFYVLYTEYNTRPWRGADAHNLKPDVYHSCRPTLHCQPVGVRVLTIFGFPLALRSVCEQGDGKIQSPKHCTKNSTAQSLGSENAEFLAMGSGIILESFWCVRYHRKHLRGSIATGSFR